MPGWRRARLTERTVQTATGRTLTFEVARWPGHLPGQHVDVRLTAADGYQAVRSYSLAAPADTDRIELGVQAVPGGEVSPYLADDLPVDAEVEVKGPLGGWFVWTPEEPGPLLLIAGGSGIVPLMAMLRARLASASDAPCTLLYSVRGPDEVWYATELDSAAQHTHIRRLYTRLAPADSERPAGRVTKLDLLPPAEGSRCYVCGPTGFVEHVSALLLGAGHAPDQIRTERFG
ncbi:ferredoxin reductase [Streptomyces antibioticus]|uniref:ferredoxin reductase n=1 Tax=Streptomyces antibioticus TaxID=1890 RepID=UPI0022521EF4|nr:ferredoxin reductase [Streptomyces antibioticus]MCX5166610.1 ferredoxin reductase [Streptomyces antibioticus]